MNIDFKKYADGLVPAIVQDAQTKNVLMLGFMNQAAVDATLSLKKLPFSVAPKTGYGPRGRKVDTI